MDNIKDKLLQAINDGLIDSIDVVDKLLLYIDDNDLQNILEDNNWDELCGMHEIPDYEEDE